jgi:hypothetical protein
MRFATRKTITIDGLRGQASEIRGIPERTIREEELRATVEQEQKLVEMLSANLETQRLKENSARNEVFVQDSAVAPFKPTSNTALQIIPAGLALGLLVGLALSILLDLLDKRVRYPEQVSGDLRLDIIGAIPLVHPGRPSVGRNRRSWWRASGHSDSRCGISSPPANRSRSPSPAPVLRG